MNDRYSLAAGLFIVVSIGLILYVLVQISDTGAFAQKQDWTLRFPAGSDLQGLREDSPVRLFGVEVGKVKAIRIHPSGASEDPAGVDVRISLPEDFALRDGAKVTVQSGLTGGALVYIDDLGMGSPLNPDQPVPGKATSLAQVLASLGDALPTATETLTSVRTAVDNGNNLILKVSGKVDPLTEQVAGVLDKADSSMTYVRDLLGDTTPDLRQTIANLRSFTGDASEVMGESKQDLGSTIANLNQITTTARDRLPGTLDRVDGALDQAQSFIAQAKGSFEAVDAVLENAKVATGQLRTTLAENRPKIDRAMTNVKRAAEHLEAGLAEIRAAPWRLLNQPDKVDEHNLVVYAAARELASGAADLETTAATLEALTADPNADPDRLQELREQLIRKYRDLAEAQDEIWNEYRRRR